jgi:DNA-directed RNA polymerase beta subunit
MSDHTPIRGRSHQKEASDLIEEDDTPELPSPESMISEPPDYEGFLREKFGKMEIDPEVSYRNLGKAYPNVGGSTLLDTSHKLLKIARHEAETDDRDALYNKTFHTPDDFFEERVAKDAGRLGKALLWKVKKKRTLDAIPSGWFSPQLEGVILKNQTVKGSPLSQAVPGINPIELLDNRYKIVPTGEGGISSYDMVPNESRNVHTTHIGFFDHVKTPESIGVGIDQRLGWGVRKGANNTVYMPMLDRRTGKRTWVSPGMLYGKRVAFASKVPVKI